MTPVTFRIFLLTVKKSVLCLGADGNLRVPEDQTSPSSCLLRYHLWYFTFRGGTGWIRIGHKISESLNNVSEEGAGAERSIDVGQLDIEVCL